MRLLISPVLSILIAVSASIGILDSFRLDGEPQSITPDENNPDHNLFSGGDLSPVAFNNLNPTPDSCIASTGGLQTTGKLWARLDCDHMNLENPEESGSAREYQPVAPDAQGGTGQENGNGKKVNGNGYRNNRPQESDQQGELNSNPLPGGGANNRLPPNLPFRNDPLDECKGYFAVFEYVVCDSGKSTISRAILDDIIGHEHPLLPNMETFTLKHCTQGMFREVRVCS